METSGTHSGHVTRPAGSMLKECSPDTWESGLRENLVVGDVSSDFLCWKCSRF